MIRMVFFLSIILLLVITTSAQAWMGAMYRERPGYGQNAVFNARIPVPRTGMWYQQRRSAIDNIIQDNELPEVASSCLGAPCRSDDACCDALVCKLPEPEVLHPIGTCVPNPNEGALCKSDETCGSELECTFTPGSRGFKSCQPRIRDASRKQLNDECRHSLECDQSRNLCCQLHRRHRQAPRQICMYYRDSHQCLGFKKSYMGDNSFVDGLKNKWWQY